VRLNFFGDVSLQDVKHDTFSIDPSITKLIDDADCNIANLEGPLTYSADGMPYQSILRKAEPVKSELVNMFDIFSLANNHIMDFKMAGLLDTIVFLRSLNKGYFGVGLSRSESFQPFTTDVKKTPVAFLGFTRWHRAGRKAAGTTPDDVRQLSRRVCELSRLGYFVIVYAHWNYEYIDYPAPQNRRIARKLIDAGADLILGSHPHVIQGYEKYRGKFIFHSLGNFIFNLPLYNDDWRLKQTFVLTINVNEDKTYTHEITPVYTDASSLRILKGREHELLLQRLTGLSSVLNDDERVYKARFYEDAANGVKKLSQNMKKTLKNKGIMYILSRLHRIRTEDLKIKLYSMLHH
jgi:poly-gamma-glutamate capsule biosynthesis protein CapA/YwtB (metallophosphatase superfamily)